MQHVYLNREQSTLLAPARAGAQGKDLGFTDIQLALGNDKLTPADCKQLRQRLVSLYKAATDADSRTAIRYVIYNSPALEHLRPPARARSEAPVNHPPQHQAASPAKEADKRPPGATAQVRVAAGGGPKPQAAANSAKVPPGIDPKAHAAAAGAQRAWNTRSGL